VRPLSALGDRSAEEFARDWKLSSAAAVRTAGPARSAPAGAVHRADATDPKLLELFVPPSDVKGGAEKLPKDGTEQPARKSELLAGC
jgi:hypothetical protein